MERTELKKHLFHNGFEYEVDYKIKDTTVSVCIEDVHSPDKAPECYIFQMAPTGLQYYIDDKFERFIHKDASIAPALLEFVIHEIDWKMEKAKAQAQHESEQ